jgi:hypothetical protein
MVWRYPAMNDQRTKIMSHRKSTVVTIPMTRSSIVVCKTHLQVGNGNTGSNVFVFGLVLRLDRRPCYLSTYCRGDTVLVILRDSPLDLGLYADPTQVRPEGS